MTLHDLPTHPLWPKLVPLLRVQTYDRDGGHRHPRHRIEVDDPDTATLRAQLLQIEVACVQCGRPIYPIRARKAPAATLYLAVACDLGQRYACSRGAAAHDAYETLVAMIQQLAHQRPPQNLGLWP